MKKILAMVLAMMLVLSMSVAFAVETDPKVNEDVDQNADDVVFTDIDEFAITKNYILNTAGMASPAETFNFEVGETVGYDGAGGAYATSTSIPVITIKGNGQNATYGDTASITYAVGGAGSATAEQKLWVDLPEYTKVGVYTYTISETANDIAGVTYLTSSITVTVTVINQPTSADSEFKCRVVAVSLTDEEGEKVYNFDDNSYSAGTLTVKKNVEGNMGDHAASFDMTVTFTSDKTVNSTITLNGLDADLNWTEEEDDEGKTYYEAVASISVSEENPAVFSNIPYEVEYEVAEDEKYLGDATADHPEYGYDSVDYDTNKSGTIDENTPAPETTVTNTKGEVIATGISLDNAPYMILMGLVVLAGAALIVKRASANR